MKLPIALSNRHLHLSREHLDALFGKGHELVKTKDLSQPGQYACEEKVDVIGPRGSLKGLRVLGPVRNKTQIEVSLADARALGVVAPIRDSGDLDGSPGAKLVGPAGEVEIKEGVIVAARHIHMSLEEAEQFGVKNGDVVDVQTFGQRGLLFNNVVIRSSAQYSLEMHVDLEEGNAAGVANGDLVELIRKG